jgi:hypothetical protein
VDYSPPPSPPVRSSAKRGRSTSVANAQSERRRKRLRKRPKRFSSPASDEIARDHAAFKGSTRGRHQAADLDKNEGRIKDQDTRPRTKQIDFSCSPTLDESARNHAPLRSSSGSRDQPIDLTKDESGIKEQNTRPRVIVLSDPNNMNVEQAMEILAAFAGESKLKETLDGESFSDELSNDELFDGELSNGEFGMTAGEIEEQKRAYREIEAQRKAYTQYEEQHKNSKQDQDRRRSFENMSITSFKISDDGRKLYYEITYISSGTTRWSLATDLRGDDWTQKMAEFWYNDDESCMQREAIEHARGSDKDCYEPPPYGRFIVQAVLVDERILRYEKRKFERRDSTLETDKDDD